MRKVEIAKDFKERIAKGIPPTQQDVSDFQKILDDHSIIVKVIAGAMKKGVDTAPFEKTRNKLEWEWQKITRYDTRGCRFYDDFKKTIVVEVVYFLNHEYSGEKDGGVAYNRFMKSMRQHRLFQMIYEQVKRVEVEDFIEEVTAETIDEAFKPKKETPKPQPQPKKLPTIVKQEPKKNHKALVLDESIEVESSIPPFLNTDTIMKIVEMLKRQHTILVKRQSTYIYVTFKENESHIVLPKLIKLGFWKTVSYQAQWSESMQRERYFSKYGVEAR